MHRGPSAVIRTLILLLAVTLGAAGCADDRGTDAPAPTLPSAGTGDAATSPDDGSAPPTTEPPPTTTTTTLRPPPPTDPPEIPVATFGDLEIPCGLDGGPLPPGPGVDDAAIAIGTGNDRGGIATAGAGRGVVEAVEALVATCNRLGGIGDRDLRSVEYDAAAVEAAARVDDACRETLALVGYAYLQAVEVLQGAAACGLPLFPAGAGLLNRSPFPLHGHLTGFVRAPETAAAVGLVGPDTPFAAAELDRRARAIAAADAPLEVVATLRYTVDAEPDWGRIVGELRARGAGQVYIAGGCSHAVVPFLEVADRAGWAPVAVIGPDGYDEDCLGAPGAERLLVELPFLPFEDGDAAPVTAELAAELDLSAAPRTGHAVLAASAFWRWATAVGDCLPELTRPCLVGAAPPDDWTAGGLHPKVAPDGTSEPCAVVLDVVEGSFSRLLPGEPGTYECGPDLSVEVP